MSEVPILLLFLVPPIAALHYVYRRFTNESNPRKFQFGIPELLILPIAVAPSVLAFICANSNFFGGLAIGLSIYQFSFALLGWAHHKEPTGWGPAFGMLVGAYFAPLLLVIWPALTAFVFISFLFRPMPRDLQNPNSETKKP